MTRDLMVKATLLGHISSLEDWTGRQMRGERRDISSYGSLSLRATLRLFHPEDLYDTASLGGTPQFTDCGSWKVDWIHWLSESL